MAVCCSVAVFRIACRLNAHGAGCLKTSDQKEIPRETTLFLEWHLMLDHLHDRHLDLLVVVQRTA